MYSGASGQYARTIHYIWVNILFFCLLYTTSLNISKSTSVLTFDCYDRIHTLSLNSNFDRVTDCVLLTTASVVSIYIYMHLRQCKLHVYTITPIV